MTPKHLEIEAQRRADISGEPRHVVFRALVGEVVTSLSSRSDEVLFTATPKHTRADLLAELSKSQSVLRLVREALRPSKEHRDLCDDIASNLPDDHIADLLAELSKYKGLLKRAENNLRSYPPPSDLRDDIQSALHPEPPDPEAAALEELMKLHASKGWRWKSITNGILASRIGNMWTYHKSAVEALAAVKGDSPSYPYVEPGQYRGGTC